MADEKLPPDPGTSPVPEGHVRLWHYTPLKNVPSIREHGLQRQYARGDAGNGDLSDPSAGMWASTDPPHDILNHSEGHAGVVEFHAHPDEISGNAESPWRALNKDRSYDPGKLREWNEGNHHVIMRGSVPPEHILAIHEPWHHAARYMRNGDPTLKEYQWVKDDYAKGGNEHLEPYVRGLRALEGPAHEVIAHFEDDSLHFPDGSALVEGEDCPGCGQHITRYKGTWWNGDDTPHDCDDFEGDSQTAGTEDSHPREASVHRFAALENPHTHGHDWYHGSPHRFSEFADGSGSVLEHEDDPEDQSHWNSLLGNHFAASHEMAEEFSKGEHGGSEGHGEEGPAQNVLHARLELKNPKVYGSEHDMDQEAYEHEWKAGNHHELHHDPEELTEARAGGWEDELPRTYQYAGHGDRMRPQSEADPEYMRMGHYHPYATGWLNAHPDKYGIAMRHRQRLTDQGHDSIVYGNEFEKHHGTADSHHICAVPFRADQVDVTQRHTGEHCVEPEAAARQWPGRSQPALPGMEDPENLHDVVAHFETSAPEPVRVEGKIIAWDDKYPSLEDPHGSEPVRYWGNGLKQLRHPNDVPGPLYHGSNREFEPGGQIEPGHPGNFVSRMKHVYMTEQAEPSDSYKGARGYGRHVYEVRPTGPFGQRKDARRPEWATEDPLEVIRRVPDPREGCAHTAALMPGPDQRSAAEGASRVPSFTWKYQTYGPNGDYVDEQREVTGPFYHGSRSRRLRPGSQVKKGMPTNPWGDEGERSQFVHFTTDLGGATSYARQAGGHVYEVEPTGEVRGGYTGSEFKSEHPISVIRRVPDEELNMHTAAVVAHFEGPAHHIEDPGTDEELRQHALAHHPRLAPYADRMSGHAMHMEHEGEHGPGNIHPERPVGGGEGHVHRQYQAPAEPEGPQPPGHFDYYRGLDKEDAQPRLAQLEEHLSGFHSTRREVQRVRNSVSWEHPQHDRQLYLGMDAVHRRAHETEDARARSAEAHGSPAGWADHERHLADTAHHPEWNAEEGERQAHEDAVRDHRENGSVRFHGETTDFPSAERHLREEHGIPEHAMPAYQLWSTPRHDPYERSLEDVHDQAHGEMGSYRHDEGDASVSMHGQYVGSRDAEHHLVQHHGHEINDLRRDEPDLEREHRQSHERDARYLSHRQSDRMDEEGHLPDHPNHREEEDDGGSGSGGGGMENYEPDEAAIHQEHWRRPENMDTHADAPSEHDVDHGTAHSWQPTPYVEPPRDQHKLFEHLMEHHGVTQSADSNKQPGQSFMIGLHEKFHNGELPDRGTSHQHDNPEGHDPVFGSRGARELVAHFGERGPAVPDLTARDAVLAPAGTFSPLLDAIAAFGAWESQDTAEAVRGTGELEEVFEAAREGLQHVARMLEDLPLHPDVADAVHELARTAALVEADFTRIAAMLPPEAAWEEPGRPNR